MDPQYQAALRHALRLLARKGYFENALREKLRARCPDPDAVEKVIDKLKSLNYLNDLHLAAGLARGWREERDLLLAASLARGWREERSWGRHRVVHELMRRGLSKDAAEASIQPLFAEQTEAGALARAVAKWQRSHGPAKSAADRKKLADYLARRGFDFADIRRQVPRIDTDGEDEPYDWQ
jgi:SOS response regulatory protein OraA/RecX